MDLRLDAEERRRLEEPYVPHAVAGFAETRRERLMAVEGVHVSGDAPRRRALLGLGATFGVNGAIYATMLPRFPQIADQVSASEGPFGIALLAGAVGGLLGAAGAPMLARRLGAVRLVPIVGVGFLIAVVAVALTRSVPALAGVLLVVGVLDGAHDVVMNEVALGEQERGDRSIMGRLHGVWSLGMTAAAAIGAALAGAGVPVLTHLSVAAALLALLQLWGARRLRGRPSAPPAPGPRPAAGGRSLPRVGLALLGVAALAATFVESPGQEWTALLLERGLGAGAGLAGTGPLVFSGGMLAGRLVVDTLIDRLGGGRVGALGGALTAVGMAGGLVVSVSTGLAWPALVGLAVAGLGAAPTFPLLFGAADRLTRGVGLPQGSGSGLASTLSRVGAISAPAIVGQVAELAGLPVALGLMAVGGGLVAVTLPALLRPRASDPGHGPSPHPPAAAAGAR